MPSLLHKAASQGGGGEGQNCGRSPLEAVCCVLSYILKFVADLILGHLGPKICCVQQAHGKLKDTAIVDKVGCGAV